MLHLLFISDKFLKVERKASISCTEMLRVSIGHVCITGGFRMDFGDSKQ